MRTIASDEGTKRGWGARRAGGVLVRVGAVVFAAVAFGAGGACSLIVDTNANQCQPATVDNDCGGFPGLRTCMDNVCQVPAMPPTCTAPTDCAAYAHATCVSNTCVRGCMADSDCGGTQKCNTTTHQCAAPNGCNVNADCQTRGTYYICRKDTLQCVNLQSQGLCTTVYGDYMNDNAFIFGSVLPTTGSNSSTGAPIQNAIELAMDDFKQNAQGLPPVLHQTARRPLVLVGCNDQSDSMTSVSATKHLVNDVGVPAIIGAAFSGLTIADFTGAALMGKVMLFSPSATSVAITTLDTSMPRLLWRASPPDSFQATALSLYTSDPTNGLEQRVRKSDALMASQPTKVAILHKGDAYGSGLASAFQSLLMINGMPALGQGSNYANLDYGNPDDPTSDPIKIPMQITATIAQAPHIVYLFGTDEAVTQVFEGIESGWNANVGYFPYYVFSDGGEIPALPMYVAMREGMSTPPPGASTLRSRISGSVPGTNNNLFQAFVQEYNGKYNDGTSPATFGAAGGYDIVYMLAYSAASLTAQGVPNPAVTGPDLASGMANLVPQGATTMMFPVGGNNINPAFMQLINGGRIDYVGASGPLNFDLTHGEAPSDIQIWCLSTNTDPTQAEVNSALYYDATQSTLAGAFSNCH